MLENMLLKEILVLFGLTDVGISALFLVSMTVIYYKYKDVKTKISSGEKKSNEIMAEIQSHVTGCQEKAEEAHKIRLSMQSQLSRIEGYLEAKKNK